MECSSWLTRPWFYRLSSRICGRVQDKRRTRTFYSPGIREEEDHLREPMSVLTGVARVVRGDLVLRPQVPVICSVPGAADLRRYARV